MHMLPLAHGETPGGTTSFTPSPSVSCHEAALRVREHAAVREVLRVRRRDGIRVCVDRRHECEQAREQGAGKRPGSPTTVRHDDVSSLLARGCEGILGMCHH